MYSRLRPAKIPLTRIERIIFMAMAIVLIRRCMITGCGSFVKDRSGVSDAGSMKLNASGFAPSLDVRNDPAIFGARVLDRHYKHLMPFSISATRVVGHNTECSAFSLLEFAKYLF
jgi:hypothetical protein